MEQLDLLKYAVLALDRLEIPYAIVGSFASGAWGESRFTQDIDIVVDLVTSQADELCRAFPDDEFYVSKSAVREAIQHETQFNVINPDSGNKIDFMIAGTTAWALSQLKRSRTVALFPDITVQFAAPEDVIIGKLIYYREGGSEKHLRDISGIMSISGDDVDRHYVSLHAAQLGVEDIWREILDKIEQ